MIDGRESSTAVTDTDGNFHFDITSGRRTQVTVEAAGFRSYTGEWNGTSFDIILAPASVSALVTVTRTETHLGDTPQSVVMLRDRDIGANPAVTLDDKLRQVPGFTLFRRSGSRTANPTSQGVSLRGTGGSGASRAAVVLDEIALNDPFGGWIYWGRVPIESIDEVEVLRGSAGELSGSSAIGGIIDLRTKHVSEPLLDV